MADATVASVWREPSALLPLRWGEYRTRLLGGLALAVAGGVAIAGGGAITPFANLLLVVGTAAHVTGWAVLPAAGWRRVWALIPSIVVMWALLAGPRWLWVLVVPYLGWLLARHRSLATAPTALLVLAAALLAGRAFGAEYSGMLPALGVVAATGVLAAWLARTVHVAQWRMRRGRKPRRS